MHRPTGLFIMPWIGNKRGCNELLAGPLHKGPRSATNWISRVSTVGVSNSEPEEMVNLFSRDITSRTDCSLERENGGSYLSRDCAGNGTVTQIVQLPHRSHCLTHVVRILGHCRPKCSRPVGLVLGSPRLPFISYRMRVRRDMHSAQSDDITCLFLRLCDQGLYHRDRKGKAATMAAWPALCLWHIDTYGGGVPSPSCTPDHSTSPRGPFSTVKSTS